MHTIKNTLLSVSISEHGAEMHSIKDASGNEYLWQADETVWARHAPHLFPIVGRLQNDELLHNGSKYTMSQHGFARDSVFKLEDSSDNSCTWLLRDNKETFAQYPFHFELRLRYALDGNKLTINYDIFNTGNEVLPCSVGAHPAFNWPLPGSKDRGTYVIAFSTSESCDIRRLDAGLLKRDGWPWPWSTANIKLEDELFEDDAMIFTDHKSRQLTLRSDGEAAVTVDFADFPHLGIWSKPGAGFVCLEPWQGHSDPVDFNGEFSDKPGIVHIQPGQSRQWTMTITITPA